MFRNTAEVYADLEERVPELEAGLKPDEAGLEVFEQKDVVGWRKEYSQALNRWAQALVQKTWVVCCEKDEGRLTIKVFFSY